MDGEDGGELVRTVMTERGGCETLSASVSEVPEVSEASDGISKNKLLASPVLPVAPVGHLRMYSMLYRTAIIH